MLIAAGAGLRVGLRRFAGSMRVVMIVGLVLEAENDL